MNEAFSQGIYLEAAWIAYAMAEDHTNSALAKSGGPVSGMLGTKLQTVKNRTAAGHAGLVCANMAQAAQDAIDWKNDRKPLTHDMADVPRAWADINSDAEVLARRGREVAGRYRTAVMSLRKWDQKYRGR